MPEKPKAAGSFKKPKKESFGLDVRQLKLWNQLRIQQQLDTEGVKQEIAVARVRGFLDAIGKSCIVIFMRCPDKTWCCSECGSPAIMVAHDEGAQEV